MGLTAEETIFCCEHTGIYTSSLIAWITEKGYNLWLEKGLQIKRSIGIQRGKNDKIDAQRIAAYAFRFQDQAKIFIPPRAIVQELKHLIALRERLVSAKKTLKTSLNELVKNTKKGTSKHVENCSKSAFKAIESDIKRTEQTIKKIIKSDEAFSKKLAYAISVKGVGFFTALYVLVSTNELHAVKSAKSLACYAGIAPFPYQSGSSIHGRCRVSHLANKTLKSLLHLCALSAKTHSKEFQDYFERKKAEGKHVMSILNAIRNKIITRIYVCISNEKMYNENYSKKFA